MESLSSCKSLSDRPFREITADEATLIAGGWDWAGALAGAALGARIASPAGIAGAEPVVAVAAAVGFVLGGTGGFGGR
jgi:hypothetical protein